MDKYCSAVLMQTFVLRNDDMSPEVQKVILEAARLAGDHLKGKLPPHHMHPKGRNSYAHIFERIKSKMGRSYKDCEDWEAPRILDLIEYYTNNPC